MFASPTRNAIYYGGQIAGKLGALVQYNYDGIEKKWGAEMGDIRYADSATWRGKDFTYGISASNSPDVVDVWNNLPMWSFPHTETPAIMPMYTTLMDMTLPNQVAGVSAYGFYDSQFYAEIGFFRNGKKGALRFLNAGDELETAIDGTAPHARLAWERALDSGSFQIGAHYIRAKVFPDAEDQSGPKDRFTDWVIDSQYQQEQGDHLFSVHAFYSHEKRDWEASFPAGMASNPSDKLETLRIRGHYWYQRRFGGGIEWFDYRGDSDMLKYGMVADEASASGNVTGSPNTRGWIAELDWLPLPDRQNLKIGVRYTSFTKFNGAGDDYNGFGRKASDNNSVFVYLWALL